MMAVENIGASLPFTAAGLPSGTRHWPCLQFPRPARPSTVSAHKKRSDDGENGDESHRTPAFPLSKFYGPESVALQPLSKETAMTMVLKAAVGGRGWTTGSGMEGPAISVGSSDDADSTEKSVFPWALFTKSPRRRMRVAFTCGVCGQRTTRAINPHAYTDGTVFVQCAGCDVYHKLVDNLNLFHDVKGGILPKYAKRTSKKASFFDLIDIDDDFPIL